MSDAKDPPVVQEIDDDAPFEMDQDADMAIGEDVPFEIDIDDADRVSDARRRLGRGGAMLAAGMLGLDQILMGKKKEEAPIVVDANSDPVDIDSDGIRVQISDDAEVVAPPLPRTAPLATSSKSRRQRRGSR